MGRRVKEVSIRQGQPSDARSLARLLASQRMATDVDPAEFVVAEEKGRLLGAARLEWVGTDDAYLRPIAVTKEAQRTGLGSALLEKLCARCSSISVIARGDAVPFYKRSGFTATDWSSVREEYRDECESCDDLAQCQPVPMRRTLKHEGLSDVFT